MSRVLKEEIRSWMTRKEAEVVLVAGKRRVDKIIQAIDEATEDSLLVRARMGFDAARELSPKYHVTWVISRLHIMKLPTVQFSPHGFACYETAGFHQFSVLSDLIGDGEVTGDPEVLALLLGQYLGACIPKVDVYGVNVICVPLQEPRGITYGLDWEVFDWKTI